MDDVDEDEDVEDEVVSGCVRVVHECMNAACACGRMRVVWRTHASVGVR